MMKTPENGTPKNGTNGTQNLAVLVALVVVLTVCYVGITKTKPKPPQKP